MFRASSEPDGKTLSRIATKAGLEPGLACDGIVTGIQISGLGLDTALYRTIKKP
jgi:hypothetical protein